VPPAAHPALKISVGIADASRSRRPGHWLSCNSDQLTPIGGHQAQLQDLGVENLPFAEGKARRCAFAEDASGCLAAIGMRQPLAEGPCSLT